MRVVIVGGGFAGIKAAMELSNQPDISFTLICKSQDFEYHSALYRSTPGKSPLDISFRISDALGSPANAELVIDTMKSIDPVRCIVYCDSGQEYVYDRLILALGHDKDASRLEGQQHFAYSVYSHKDTVALRSSLVELFKLEGRDKVRVAIVGAGPVGVELAGELQEYANDVAMRYGTQPKSVEVDLIERESRVLPSFDPVASNKALIRLEKLKVRVLTSKRAERFSQNSVRTQDGEFAADIIVWAGGNASPKFFEQNPTIFQMQKGKVLVTGLLQSPLAQSVFILGDNAFTPQSGMAQTAIFDGIFVASNLIRETRGEPPIVYSPRFPIYVVPIGKNWALMQNGQKVRSGRAAWFMRRIGERWIMKNFKPYRVAHRAYSAKNKQR